MINQSIVSAVSHETGLIRFAGRLNAGFMATALADPKKFGQVVFEALFERDKIRPETVLSVLAQAKESDWADATLMYGWRWLPKERLPELVGLLSPEAAYWRCICVPPEPLIGKRELFMQRLHWWQAYRLLTVWGGKWTADEEKLLRKIADGG